MPELIKLPSKCPRCGCEFKIAVEAPGRYETHCPDCNAWIPVESK